LGAEELRDLFDKKCQVRQINPEIKEIASENLKDWNKDAWENQLRPLMRDVTDFGKVWKEWSQICRELFG
jgi:hypothetical protein